MKLKQKYKLQNYLFKSFLIIILTLILSFFITYYFYKCYIKEINIYTINVLDKVTNKYPLVNPNDILNYDHNIDPHIINKYGVTSNQSLLKEINNIALKNYIIIVIFTLSISLLFILFYLKESYAKNKELENIIKTLKKVNHNIYDLELDLEEEGTFAILKEEIYKHTKMLKELSLKNIDDKQNLKNTLANISHQIKTPLTSISILVDNLMNENIDKNTQREFLEDIRFQIDNINFLVLSLLKLSKFEANVIEFKETNINVYKMIQTIIKNLDSLIKKKNLNIYLNIDKDIYIKGDYKWEIEALTNILKNSIEHTNDNKNIYIKGESNKVRTKIVIKDEGSGIAKSDLTKVFNRYYHDLNNLNNFGIGLSLAKEIINKDNGKIIVKSEVGKGTIFTIKYFA